MKDKSCHLKILFIFVQHPNNYCNSMQFCCNIQWIFIDPFSIIYFLAFLLTFLKNSMIDIFSMGSSNYRFKFKPLRSKTINKNFFSSSSGLGFFLGSTPRWPSLLLLFLLVEDSAILDTRNNKPQREYCVLLSQCLPTLRICKN